jgi:hypothetical protein
LIEDTAGTAGLAQRIFDSKLWRQDQPLRVVLIGTDFEVRVWETLLKIPMGRAVSYSDIACKIEKPEGFTRRRRAPSGKQSDFLRGAVSPRAWQIRRTDRLSLGHYAQAGDDRLGSRASGERISSNGPQFPAAHWTERLRRFLQHGR